jgi:hypothetical protein
LFTLSSRYAAQPVLETTRGDGLTVRYVLPRILPAPEDLMIAVRHRASDGDRIDNLAWRHVASPTAWWMLAEANRVIHPAELPGEPGDTMLIPVPGTGKVAG